MIIKNLNPKVFSDIESEEGAIKEAFRCKEKYVAAKIKQIEDSIRNSERELERFEKEALKGSDEVKQVLLQQIVANRRIKDFYVENTNQTYTYEQIMKHDFDMTLFLNKKRIVRFYNNSLNTTQTKTIVDIESEYTKDGEGYIERWQEAHNREEERNNQIRKNIEQKKAEMRALRKASLASLINKYGSTDIFDGNETIIKNFVLVFMLRNGYINENYANYINNYHHDSINKEEHEFIMNVRNYGGAKPNSSTTVVVN